MRENATGRPTLALTPRADVTRSPKERYISGLTKVFHKLKINSAVARIIKLIRLFLKQCKLAELHAEL